MDVLTAGAPAALPGAAPAAPVYTLPRVTRLLAAVGAGDRSPELLAALADITQTSVGADVAAPAWLGELWSANGYTRQIVPLMNQGQLTSYKLTGWRWSVLPAGDDYTGDKAAVPSNAATTEPVDVEASRWAGAHDVDRKMRDFGDQSFWDSYWAAMGASYSAWTDDQAVTALLAGASTATPAGTGVVAAIVAGVLKVLPYGTPSYTLLGETAFAELVERDPLAFLSGQISLPTGDGNVGGLAFRASSRLGARQIVVGIRNAATFYELGGGAPIRAEALNIANGGVDVGAFGYAAVNVHDARGIVKVTSTVAP